MTKFTISDLEKLRLSAAATLTLRESSNTVTSGECCSLSTGTAKMQILVCGGTGCKASSSHTIADNLKDAIERENAADRVEVITTGCFGFCEKGPVVKIIPDNTFYVHVKPEDADEIIK